MRRAFNAFPAGNEESVRLLVLLYRLGLACAIALTLVVPCLMLVLRADPRGLDITQTADILLLIASLTLGPLQYLFLFVFYNVLIHRRLVMMRAAHETVSDEVLQVALRRMIGRAHWLHSFLCRRRGMDLANLVQALLPGGQTRRVSFWESIKWDSALAKRWFRAMSGNRAKKL